MTSANQSVAEISSDECLAVTPLVSVMMLTFNHEHFLEEAISGVVDQKCNFSFELIIADDCSTDNTLEIALEYQRRYPSIVRVLRRSKNVGVRRNSTYAQELCRGQYIAACEGDDYWCDASKLQDQADMLDGDLRLGMVHADFLTTHFSKGKWVVTESGVHHNRPLIELEGDLFKQTLSDLVPRLCTTMYRKAVLDEFLNSSLSSPKFLAGDHAKAVFCSATWQIGYLPKVVAVYRVNPASITRGSFKNRLRFLKSVQLLYDEFEKLYSSRSDYDPNCRVGLLLALAKTAFRASELELFSSTVERLQGYELSRANRVSVAARDLVARHALAVSVVNRIANLLNWVRGR